MTKKLTPETNEATAKALAAIEILVDGRDYVAWRDEVQLARGHNFYDVKEDAEKVVRSWGLA